MDGLRWAPRELLAFGRILDERSRLLGGESVAMWLGRSLLRVRDRHGAEVALVANAVQRLYERERGRRNIVLKARQMGMTTWVSGMFFLRTISQPGVLTVQVAQTREAAEGIFRMVQRFWESLPEELREGPLRLTRSNAGQMRFGEMDSEFRVLSASDANAGRGLTIQNLHCSELGRWPGGCGGDAGGAAGGAGARWGDGARVHGEWGVWVLLRRVAERGGEGDGASLLSVVDGAGVCGCRRRRR